MIDTPLPEMPDAPPPFQQFTYPRDVRQVTAERLTMALTISAQRIASRHMNTVETVADGDNSPSSIRILGLESGLLVHLHATVALLRDLQRRCTRPEADEIARALWLTWDSGDLIYTEIWEWIEEYKIPADPKTGTILIDQNGDPL